MFLYWYWSNIYIPVCPIVTQVGELMEGDMCEVSMLADEEDGCVVPFWPPDPAGLSTLSLRIRLQAE